MKISFQKTIWKIRILVKAIQILINWYWFPIIYFKLTKKKHIILKTRNKHDLKIRVNSSDIQIFTEIWLEKSYLKKLTMNKTVIIDIGAHIGLFSIFYSHYKNMKIFCYEPDKNNFKLLEDNIKINKCTNIICENIAVTNDSSKKIFYTNQDSSAHSMYKKTDQSIEINSISLDQIFNKNQIEKCDLLKMDCEGSEYEILLNLSNLNYKKIKNIFVEYHIFNDDKEQLKKLELKLKENDFKINKTITSQKLGYIDAQNQNFK